MPSLLIPRHYTRGLKQYYTAKVSQSTDQMRPDMKSYVLPRAKRTTQSRAKPVPKVIRVSALA